MTILIAANTSWNLVHFRGNLIRRLQARGYRIVACAPRDEFTESLIEMGVSYHETPMRQRGLGIASDLILFVRYFMTVWRHKPHALVTFTIKPNLYLSLVARLWRVPAINNISGLGYAFLKHGLLRSFVTMLYRLSLKRSSRVFFQNPSDYDLFRRAGLVSELQSRLLPGSGVDLSRFTLTPFEKAKRTKFLFIGRLLPEKGIMEFLDAATILVGQCEDIEILILGALPESPALAAKVGAKINQLGNRGRYLGVLRDVRPAISECHCVVLPSYREGAPRSILEASAMGRPVIVSDVPGCVDVVKPSISGLLCAPGDTADLAKKMIEMNRLSHDQRVRMGRAGSEFVRGAFDEQFVLSAYEEAVEMALDKRA